MSTLHIMKFSECFLYEERARFAVHPVHMKYVRCFVVHMLFVLRRSELPTTDTEDIAMQERNAGRLCGDIGPRRHGDADIRLRESGSIVHTVSRHGDNSTLRLQLFYFIQLILRKYLCNNFINADLVGDESRCVLVVSG